MPGYSEIQRKANDRTVWKKRSVEMFGTIFGIHVQTSNRDADIFYLKLDVILINSVITIYYFRRAEDEY